MLFQKDSHQVYRASALEQYGWLEHGFGTRLSGGWLDGRPHATLRQVHSATALRASGQTGCLGEGDALYTSTPGQLLAVRTADCVPVILVDPVHRAVAIIHAGWRGAAAEIVLRTLELMRVDSSTDVKDLQVAVGPGIGPCCYEVGPEVGGLFQSWFPERDDLDRRARLDLAETVARQLLAAGIDQACLARGAPCTYCNTSEFYSYRREGRLAGRMISAVGIRPETPRARTVDPRP